MSIAAIVVAAGQGTRFGGLKQFSLFDGETIAARSVRLSRSVASAVVLVVPATYVGEGEGADVVVTGGTSRAASVRAGLEQCGNADIIVVHDAARPLAAPALFHRVVDAINAGAQAVIPGVVISDTIKHVSRDEDLTRVITTLVREDLVSVQTPQAFRRSVLERAHEHGDDASDDAALVEALGIDVVVVEGESSNFKITHSSDLELLSFLEGHQA